MDIDITNREAAIDQMSGELNKMLNEKVGDYKDKQKKKVKDKLKKEWEKLF